MRIVQCAIEIKASPKKILTAFLDAESLKKWWGVERCLIEPFPGGVYTLAWNISESGFGFISSGTITKYNPKRSLTIKNFVYLNPSKPMFGPMRLRIRVKKESDHSLITLIQDGYKEGPLWDWYYNAVQNAWPQVLESLKSYLENMKLEL